MFKRNVKACKGVEFSAPSLAARHLKKMADVNNLIARAVRGDSSAFRPGGWYGDISDLPDTLQSILDKQLAARDYYHSLPVEIQSRFTSYEAFLNALPDEQYRDFFVQHGIFHVPSSPSPVKVEVINNNPEK